MSAPGPAASAPCRVAHRTRSKTTNPPASPKRPPGWGCSHVVITSVTRDDLADGGADHFYRCVLAVRQRTRAVVEVLTPDFLGDRAAIDRVLEAAPEVYNHNMETVPRLYKKVRGRACYQRSLDLLGHVKRRAPATVTKSGLMLGLGETMTSCSRCWPTCAALAATR